MGRRRGWARGLPLRRLSRPRRDWARACDPEPSPTGSSVTGSHLGLHLSVLLVLVRDDRRLLRVGLRRRRLPFRRLGSTETRLGSPRCAESPWMQIAMTGPSQGPASLRSLHASACSCTQAAKNFSGAARPSLSLRSFFKLLGARNRSVTDIPVEPGLPHRAPASRRATAHRGEQGTFFRPAHHKHVLS